MRKLVFILALLFYSNSFYAQKSKTCDSPEEDVALLDLSNITKCSAKSVGKAKDKKRRQISVRVSASKKRFLKKRKELTSNAGNLTTSGVENTGSFGDAQKTLALRQSVANLTNTLSMEEVKKAEEFIFVDSLPKFENCKAAKKDEESDCFNTEMIRHIEKYFNYPIEAMLSKTEGDVWVRFVIDANGTVTNIKTMGPENGELLELEAKRVASKLPKFIPAVKKGKEVAVKYGFPINFSLE